MDGSTSLPSPLPRTPGGWLPYLWSCVLFPGPAASRGEPWRWRSLLVLLVVPAVLLYPCLSFHLFEPDESRYAEIPREMLLRGEWVVPYLQGEPYLDKPPLLYWLVGLSYRAFGVEVWAARLVPGLAVHLCLLAAYFLGRRSVGERAAFFGALLLGLTPGFLGMGRLLLLDGLLTLWTTLALLTAFEAVRGPRLRWGWWLAAAAATGLGVLTKGPIALLLLVPPLWLWRRLSGAGCRAGVRGWGVFAAVVLAVTVPWFTLMCVRVPAFGGQFLWEHNLHRFLAPAIHPHGVWFYVPVVLAGLFPGTLLTVPLVRFLLSGEEAVARRRTPEMGFLLLAGGWCLFFFTLSACKLPTYVLPAFPPLALALGHVFVQGRWAASRAPVVVGAACFGLFVAAHYVALPWYARYRSPVGRPAEVCSRCADPATPVVCYPRNCDSVSFYLRRDDLRSFRSKDIEDLRAFVRWNPRTVVLCTHRHSLRGLHELLPKDVHITDEVHFGLQDIPGLPRPLMRPLALLMGETALGLCDVAVVENPHPHRPGAVSPPGPKGS